MGIKDSMKQVATDFLLGRAVRKINEERHPEGVDQLGGFDPENDPLRQLLEKDGVGTDGAQLVSLSMADLVRRVLYDSGAEDPEGVIKKMGWDAPSAEVVEMEAKASERRVERVEDLSVLVHAMAQAALLPPAKIQGWSGEEFIGEFEFAAHAALSIIAQLVDLGLLEVGAPLSSMSLYEDTDEEDGEDD